MANLLPKNLAVDPIYFLIDKIRNQVSNFLKNIGWLIR